MKTLLICKMNLALFFIFFLSVCSVKSQSFSWAKNIGGSSTDIGQGITTDVSGNIYVTGYFSGTVDFDPGSSTYNLTSNGGSDIFIAKYSQAGNFIWAEKIGGSGTDVGNSIAVDSNGNLYVTGYFMNTVDFDPGSGTNNITSNGNYDIFILKLSQAGAFQWAYGMGSSYWDDGWSVAVDNSGGVYLTGMFIGSVDFDPGTGTNVLSSAGYTDIFIAKFTSSGAFSFAKSIGGTQTDCGNGISTDNSGNLYLTGSFWATVDFDPGSGTAYLTSAGSGDAFVAKYSNTGNYIWAIKLGGTSSDDGKSIDIDDSGNVYVAGDFCGTVDFNPASATVNLTSNGSSDIFVAKYNSSGNYIWAGNVGGNSSDFANCIVIDLFGNCYVTGEFESTADFNPGSGTAYISSSGFNDSYILKLNTSGNYQWAYNIGGSSEDIGHSITCHDSDLIYATGYFRNSVDFDPGSGTTILSSNGIQDIYITQLINPDCTNFSATITPTGATTFCQGGYVTIEANSGTGLSYRWFKNGSLLNGATSATYSATSSGSYKVEVTYAGTCIDTSSEVTVTVNSLPTANITANGPINLCSGDSVYLNANTGSGLIWQWRKNGTDINGATDSFLIVKTTGDYSVKIMNNIGCSKLSNTIKVKITSMPDTSLLTNGNFIICYGDTVLLKAKNDTGIYYQWRKNGLIISGATQATFPATQQGTYKLVFTTSNSCTDSSSAVSVFVNPSPTPNIIAVNSTKFCQGDSVILKTDTGYSYQWIKDGIDVTGATDSFFVANSTAVYKVLVTNSFGCTKISAGIAVTSYKLPDTSILLTSSLTFCIGDSVSFIADTTSGSVYQWKKDGNQIHGASASSYTATQQGYYKVIITNSHSCVDSSSEVFVKVKSLPDAAITSYTPTAFCEGDSVILYADTGSIYQWKMDGNDMNGKNNSTLVSKSTGIYSVKVTNNLGCSKLSVGIAVTSYKLPDTSVFLSSNTFCKGDSITFIADTTAGSFYKWEKEGMLIPGASASTYSAKQQGYYRVIITNSHSCVDSSSDIFVKVNSLPDTSIKTYTPAIFCEGDSITFFADTTSGSSYQWKKDGQNITDASASSYSAKQQGYYKIIITNSHSCIDSSSEIFVKVNSLPQVSISTLTPTTFCEGDSVNLFVDKGFFYQWQKDGTDIEGENRFKYVAKAPGKYSVMVTDTQGCSNSSILVNVDVKPLPIVNIGNDTTICLTQKLLLDAGTGFESYLWSTGDISPTIELKGIDLGTGTYKFWVKIENIFDCISSDTIQVTVVACQGINENNNSDMSIFPNPSNGHFTLKINNLSTDKGIIRIIDIYEKVIFYKQLSNSNTYSQKFNFDFLPAGIYFLRLDYGDVTMFRKIIIQ